MSRVCVFCQTEGKNLIPFTAQTLDECKDIQRIRKEHELVSSDVVLPANPSEIEGYDTDCYGTFTALWKKYRERSSAEADTEASDEDADNTIVEAEATGSSTDERIANVVCIFCNNKTKKVNETLQPLETSSKNSIAKKIQSIASSAVDLQMLHKIQNSLDHSRTIGYHKICMRKYSNDGTREELKDEAQIVKEQKCHEAAYEAVCEFVNDTIISEGQCFFLSFLRDLYLDCFKDEYEDTLDISPDCLETNFLEIQLLHTFEEKIIIVTLRRQKIVAPHSEVDLQDRDFERIEKNDILKKAAMILQNDILNIQPDKTKNPIDGECYIPDRLKTFFSTLLNGLDPPDILDPEREQLVNSFAQDTIYAATDGHIKPSKHVALGKEIKDLTGSETVVNILNRLGHCCSYNTIEKLEAELPLDSDD